MKVTDDNNFDFGNWTVPTGWSEVTLEKWQEIQRLYNEQSGETKSFDVRDVIHILCNKSIDEVNELPTEFFEIISNKLSFLAESPEVADATNKIEIDGKVYQVNIMEKLKPGEYVATDMVMKNDKYDYASILAILCRKDGEIYDSKFEAELFQSRVELFSKQPITKILPVISFFLNCYMVLSTPSQLSMAVEEELDLIANNLENYPKIGVYKKLYMRRQMKKLRKSLKSIKSI